MRSSLYASLILILLTGLLCSTSAHAELSARVSRSPVSINESFELIISADGVPDNEPDFTAVEQDFEILNRSQSQNIQMLNGEVSRNARWNLTLMAKRSGSLTIPAFSIGGDSSSPILVQVDQAVSEETDADSKDIFLRVETDQKSVYVNQQILLTVRLFRGVNTNRASLSEPRGTDPDMLVTKLGEDDQYETRIDGRRYLVIERRYALFPQRPGPLTLGPMVFQGELVQQDRRQGMFGVPFGGLGRSGQVRRIQSDPLQLEVMSRPEAAADQPWLPSSNLQLVERWGGAEEPSFRAGEPLTRTLMLFADGLTAAQLPPLAPPLPDGFKHYADQPALSDRPGSDGITGVREEKIAIVPTTAGRFTLPAFSLQWWDTEQNRLRHATLPARVVSVAPAAGEAATTRAPMNTADTLTAEDAAEPRVEARSSNRFLLGIALLLGLGWVATAVAWWRSRRRPNPAPSRKPPPAMPPRRRLGGKASAQLKSACLAADPEAAANALMLWAKERWPEAPPRSLGVLAGRFAGSDIGRELRILERNLYAAEKSAWNGKALWQAISQLTDDTRHTPDAPDPIAPLHPT